MTDLSAILGVLSKPNKTFHDICNNSEKYFKTSFVILVLTSFFLIEIPITSEDHSFETNELGYILDAQMQIIDGIVNILSGFLPIILIYYLARIFGGSKDFKKIFSVYSFSLIPMLSGIVSSVFLYHPPLFEFVSGIYSHEPLFVTTYYLTSIGIFLPCAIWSFILTIKALKIANNFGTGKAFGIIFLSAIIGFAITYPILLLVPIDHPYFELISGN